MEELAIWELIKVPMLSDKSKVDPIIESPSIITCPSFDE